MNGFSPARRLHRTLTSALEKSPDWSAAQVLCTVFGADHTVRSEAYAIFAELLRLAGKARVHVESNAALNQDLYRGPIDDVLRILASGQIDLPWRHFAGPLSGAVMRSLEFCAEKMDELADETEVAPDQILQLKELVEDLINDLVHSTIDRTLRDALLFRLEDIRTVLQRYLLYGVDGIARATENAIGTAVVRRPPPESPSEAQSMFEKFVAICKKVGTVASAAKKVLDLFEPVIRTLKLTFGQDN